MEVFLIVVVALLMVVIGFLLMSVQANQKFVQSIRDNAGKEKEKIAELEQQVTELELQLKRSQESIADLPTDRRYDEYEEEHHAQQAAVVAELAALKEKHQALQKKYHKVYQQLENFQNDVPVTDPEQSAMQEPLEDPERREMQDRIDRLEHSCGKLRLEKKQLQDHLAAAKAECRKMETHLITNPENPGNSENPENQEIFQINQELSAQNELFRTKLAEAAKQVKELRAELEEAQNAGSSEETRAELEQLAEENSRFRVKLIEAARQVERLRAEIAVLKDSAQSEDVLRSELEEFQKQSQNYQEKLLDATQHLEKIRMEQEMTSQEKQQLQETLEETVRSMIPAEEYEEIAQELEALREEFDRVESECEKLSDEKEELSSELSAMQTALESALHNEKQTSEKSLEELEQIRNQQKDTETERDFLRKELDHSADQIRDLQTELQKVQNSQESATLRQELEQIQDQNQEYCEKLKLAAGQILQLRDALAKAEQKASGVAQHSMQNAEYIITQEKLEKTEKNLEKTTKENSVLRERLHDAEQQIEDFRIELSHKLQKESEEQNTLREKLADVEFKMQATEDELKRLHEEKNAALQENQALQRELTDALENVENFRVELSSQKNQEEQQQQDQQALQEKLAIAEQQNAETQTALQDATAQTAKIQEQLQDAVNESQELREELQNIRNQNAQLREEIADMQVIVSESEQSEELRKQLDELHEENQDLRSELESLTDQNEQIQDEKQRQQEELEEQVRLKEQQFSILQAENKKLKERLEEYKNKINARRENTEAVYLQIASSVENLQKQGGTRFVHVEHDADGELILEHAPDERRAEVALLSNGAMIPNPHFYDKLVTDGEEGGKLQLIEEIFDLPELDYDSKYIIQALTPAVGEIRNKMLHVKRKGRLKI
ncbi:MAG: hypothetical protein K2J71_08380 [Oscillospiraceae bacterium]|nr:hypothetical protein [Oscillospiraceae bacterium]